MYGFVNISLVSDGLILMNTLIFYNFGVSYEEDRHDW